jgi:hypothetical protein
MLTMTNFPLISSVVISAGAAISKVYVAVEKKVGLPVAM